jgi:RimJ/RimL family protein N-acetyltransferase
MIQGKRVVLRPVEERDLALLARWRNAPENRRFFFSPFPINPGGQKKWYEGLLADRSRVMFMVDSRDGETVGVIGLDKIDWRNQEAEYGQILLDPAHRDLGYAEEAASLMVQYAFDELNLHRLYSIIYAFNQGVIRWSHVAGFKTEGVLRQAAFTGGKFHDKVIVALLREEWERDLVDASNE